MKVGVNSAIVLRGSSGTARVVSLLEAALAAGGHEVETRTPPNRHGGKIGNAARATWWDFVGFDRSTEADVLVSPTNVGRVRLGRPHVLWMQDTMVLDHPGWFDRAYALHAYATFGPSAHAATAVVTASDDARARIVARWPKSASKLYVIPWPSPDVVAQPRTEAPSSLTVLMLGATEPHKRHTLGIETVRQLRLRTSRDIRLRIVGPSGRAESGVSELLSEVDPLSTWTTREFLKDRTEVDEALRTSWCLLQCSLDEGFCLPLVESAALGLPAVHTGGGSMADVHPPGNARSEKPYELAQALERLLEFGHYREASRLARLVALQNPLEDFQKAVCTVVEGAWHANRNSARQ